MLAERYDFMDTPTTLPESFTPPEPLVDGRAAMGETVPPGSIYNVILDQYAVKATKVVPASCGVPTVVTTVTSDP